MKKNLKISFLLIFALFLNLNYSYSQGFNSVHTSDGIFVIAAGNQGNIFRSGNSGNTWAKYTEPSVNFKSVFTRSNNIWLTGDNGIVYKSNTGTTVLTPYNTGVTTSINSVHFTTDLTGYVCGDNGAIYKSVDGGVTWNLSNTGIVSEQLNSISFKDVNNGVVVGNNGKVYLTANAGVTWTPEVVTTTKNLLDVKYYSDGLGIAGEYGTLMFRSTVSAWNYVDTKVNTDIRGITGDSFNDIHVCGGGGFIRNNANSNYKFLKFEPNPMLANLVDIVYFSGIGFAVSSMNNAIIRSTNGGTSWELTAGATRSLTWVSKLTGSSGIGNNLCMHPNNRDAVFVVYGSTVYVSRNRGDNWTNIASVTGGGQAHSFYVSPVDTNIWVVAITGSPDKIKRSTNYGSTWTDVLAMNFSNYGQPLEMDQNNPSNYYFTPDGGGFYKSTDNGASFTEISGNFPFRSPCDIVVMWDSSSVIYVGDGVTGSGQAKIFKSTNGGVNWLDKYTVTSSETPSLCNTVFDKSVCYSTEWGGSGFYKTVDYAESWTLTGTTGTSGWGSDMCREDPTVVLKGTYGSPTYLTTNSGANFTSTSLGGGCGAGIMVPERGYLLAMQCSGLFKMKIDYTVITDINVNLNNASVPKDFNLYQNFPNPFNPSTSIKFDIPNSGNVSLKIYDQRGIEVNSVIEGFKNAGSYEVSFNASDLPSGVYFYKLSTKENTIAKKMLLVK